MTVAPEGPPVNGGVGRSEPKGTAARILSVMTLGLGLLAVLFGFWFVVEIFAGCEVGDAWANLLMWRLAPALGLACIACFVAALLRSRKTPVTTIWKVLRWAGLALGLLGLAPSVYVRLWLIFGPPF